MASDRMHADEIATDVPLVRRLLSAQFPRWADLPLDRVASGGTENAIYRLGRHMAVRLPLRPGGTEQVEKLHRWLPRLRPLLPLDVPLPLARGAPTDEFPFPWSVTTWIGGEIASEAGLDDPVGAARAIAGFVAALQRVDPTGGPRPGPHNFLRGVPLARRDAHTRAAIESLHGVVDTDAATAAWEAALDTPPWPGPPVWIHGDLKSDNLLVAGGRLAAVIDFGGLGVGDPACDLLVAWDLFSGGSRQAFRAHLGADHATWARGRGWALSVALIALPYYLDTNPAMVRYARRMLDQVLADFRAGPMPG